MNEVEKERQLYVQSARNNYSQDAQTRTLVPANIYGEMLEGHVTVFAPFLPALVAHLQQVLK